MTRIQTSLIGFLLLAFASQARADWQDDLSRALESRYKLGKLSFLRDNVKEPGTVLLLARDGLLGTRDSFLKNEIVAERERTAPAVMPAQGSENGKDPYLVPLSKFQPVFVTGIIVSRGRVTVNIATSTKYVSETVNRAAISRFASGQVHEDEILSTVDISTRRAALVFSFERSDLKTLPRELVEAAIDLVLLPAGDPRAPQLGNVAIGMPLDRVLTNLGVPSNVITMPEGQILVYDKIRVTVVDDRVVEVH